MGHFKLKWMKNIISLALIGLSLTIASFGQRILQAKKQDKMQVTVWDTYVIKQDGTVMHFDIIAPETEKDTAVIHNYGKAYLKNKGQEGQSLTAKECRRCHVRDLQAQWEADINRQGYYILEMENCE